jgi:hypothetical protein
MPTAIPPPHLAIPIPSPLTPLIRLKARKMLKRIIRRLKGSVGDSASSGCARPRRRKREGMQEKRLGSKYRGRPGCIEASKVLKVGGKFFQLPN